MDGNKRAAAEAIILYGDLSRELPRQRSKVVRIFTSSTFTDTSTERNALMRDTYPRLKDYCKSRHGLEFQVIDMRWGVRDEATDDHMTSQLCMTEIEACQRLSVGPNFVTFLCQKYGYRPFPPKIESDEFQKLRGTLVDNGKPVGTLDDWFMSDDNCVPPLYTLQPISSKLPYFSRNDEPEKMKAQQGEWWTTFELLQEQLRFAAMEAEQRGLLTTEQAKKFKISVTHDEVDHGILNAAQDRPEHCLCFIRKFDDLETKCEEREASKFIDINSGKVDSNAQELLSELRDKKIADALPASNIIRTDLGEWSKDGVTLDNASHEKYIRDFLETFYTKMIDMIDAGVFKEKAASLDDPLYQEIMQHLFFCHTKCDGFQGRDDVIGKVQGYVVQRASGVGVTGVPMVLHGESGSGKTSVMAKCVSLVKQTWLPGTRAATVLRFLGTSSNTSSIQRLLTMLCKHIILIYKADEIQVPSDYNQLIAAFSRVLKLASAERPLVIFLDSLDQLSSDNGAHRMAWLPKTLPPHVALVVSTLPKEHGILEKLKERLSSTSPYIQVSPFSQDESTAVLKSWLVTAQKGVTSPQLELIDKALKECSLPLFLKLVFDQAKQWRSYDPPGNCILKPSIQGMINLIFDRLEEYHGKMLVSRALSYITLSPTGLTETELDDMLSLDDDVLNDVYQFWLPPVRRIPPSLWTRIRNDISSYLVDRDADGVTVMYWYHRQFIETARQRYLSDTNLVKKLHGSCAEYFDGNWSEGRKKPCRYSSLQVKRFGVPAEAEEDRKVSGQPLTFSGPVDGGDGTVFNLRKLTQLPLHLTEAEKWGVLKTSALCNFDFLLTKVKACSMQDVLADFYRAEEKIKDPELSILLGALRLSSSVISTDPDQLAPEIIGRLMNATAKYPMLKSLVSQASERGRLSHPMLPISSCQQPPGGMLLTSLEGHTDVVVALGVTSDSRWVVTGSKDNTARIWLAENGTQIHTLSGHRECVYGIEISPDDQSCITYTFKGEYMKSGKICVWNMETGDMIHRLKGHTGGGASNLVMSLDGKYAVTGLETSFLGDDDDNEESDYEEEEVITTAKAQHKKDAEQEAIRNEEEWDEEYYDEDNRHVVIIWNLETGNVVHWLYKHTEEIKGVLATEIDDRQVVMSFSQDQTLILWDIEKGVPIREMTDSKEFPILKVALSEDKRLLAVHGCEVSMYSFPDCEFLGEASDPVSSSTVNMMYITRDKSRVISGHCCGLIRMYGTGKGTELELLKRHESFDGDEITSMAITPDEKYVIASATYKNEALVINLQTFEEVNKLPHIMTVTAVAVAPDSTKFLTASEDKNVRVWDLNGVVQTASTEETKLALVKHDQDISTVTILNAGDKVITTGSDDGTIKLWDIRNGNMLKSLKEPAERSCDAVAISSDDSFMVGSSSVKWYVLSLPDFKVKHTYQEQWLVPALCKITPDDKRLVASLGQPKFQIRIFHIDTGDTLQVVNLRSTSLHMLTSGVFVNQFKMGMYDSSGKTKILQLINSNTGAVVAELEHDDRVLSYDVAKDEIRLISGCSDGNVGIWDLNSFSLTTIKGHNDRVNAVVFSPDDTLAASGADDGGIIIWDIQSKSLSLRHSVTGAHESAVKNLMFSPDNSLVLSSADDDNYVQVWDARSGKHEMKFHTYAKVDTIVTSAKCNTAIVTLQDGRVAFLGFSPASGRPTASGPSATAAVQSGHTQKAKVQPSVETKQSVKPSAAQPTASADQSTGTSRQPQEQARKSSLCRLL